ncbi:conserved hypothetical protein [Culex quinquefasciatus]|uniref:Uncharacterized protein n=1 Tax=Culex quinquefasciatus TaxID=7176 RepID=B0WHA5_CULQU|nr:conserved hypothetical protein [Culex quinquefasciatus]|eukprot:XP_001848089.1 conserved hypothetical protein [Culex quinquefasciatus]
MERQVRHQVRFTRRLKRTFDGNSWFLKPEDMFLLLFVVAVGLKRTGQGNHTFRLLFGRPVVTPFYLQNLEPVI